MRYGKLCLPVLIAGLCAASVASQAQTYYSDRTSFDAANPGLTVETFETVAANITVSGPYDTPTAGLRLDTIGSSPDEFFMNTFYGHSLDTSMVATTNYADNSANLIFTNNDVMAAGVDLYNGDYSISIFGAGDALLGARLIDASGGAFFGVSANQVITHITLSNASDFETFDNVAFTSHGSVNVPEPSSVALILSMSLTGAGFLARRNKARNVA